MLHNLKPSYLTAVNGEFSKQPLKPLERLTTEEVVGFPRTIQHYLAYVGAVGKSKVQNVRLVFDIEMRKKPGARPTLGGSEQYNFFASPTRLFYMKAKLFGIPADGLHAYREQKASMIVRVASLFNAVNISGPELDVTETVTLMNDICLFAPAALQDDGTFKKLKFSTPARDYKEFDGRKVPSYGKAVWHYPEGEFAYGKFKLKEVQYNLKRFEDPSDLSSEF